MHNKITFHIALYCLLATATVVAMQEELTITAITSFQPKSFYIQTNNSGYYLLTKKGKIKEEIKEETTKIYSSNSIPLVDLYNKEKISTLQCKYLKEKTNNFTELINIWYCNENNIIHPVSTIPKYRIYTSGKESSDLSNPINEYNEITMDGSSVKAEFHEKLLINNDNNQLVLCDLKDDISSTQFQMLADLIKKNDVYIERSDSLFYYSVKDEITTKSTHKTKIKSFSSYLTKYLTKRTVVGIGALIALIIAAYKYNKLDGFIKFA
ncbi:MAG TPA: hypothetical protein VKR54_04695 [Candidatus Babeliales bacterium]|jgi:hypothetical protein|nr:hypothetical protein [Candidatus Babeliales bacterium]